MGSLDDFQKGIDAFLHAVNTTPRDSPTLPGRLNNLGNGLIDRYACLGKLDDLQKGIDVFQRAVKITPRDSPDLLGFLNNLGIGLTNRYARLGKLDDLQKGINAFQLAVKITPRDSPDLPGRLSNLGNGLTDRYAHLGKLEDLQKGIEAHQQAVNTTPSDSPDLSDRFNNLGNGLRNRYACLSNPDDLKKGIEAYQQAVNRVPRNSPDLSVYLNNLGNGLKNHYTQSKNPEDLQTGITAYKKALTLGKAGSLEKGLKTARNLINWAFERASWKEIIEPYHYAQEIIEKLIKTQASRADKEAWINEVQGLSSQAAYALAQLGQLEQAALVLEHGSARLLSETLAFNHADIDALKHSHRPELYAEYQAALQQYDNARFVSADHQADALKEAWQALDTVVEQIRQLKGFEQFLSVAKLEELHTAAVHHPVYISATEHGGMAIAWYEQDGQIQFECCFLPQLTDKSLREQLDHYLTAYRQRNNKRSDNMVWMNTLEDVCDWLGEVFLSPLREHGFAFEKMTLMPVGLLALLPLHAAHDTEGYTLDKWIIPYAPNARSLNQAQARCDKINSDRLFVACDPKGNLKYSKFETEMAQNFITEKSVLSHKDVRIEAVTKQLPQYNVLHFSCHGGTNMDKPLNSALQLADGNLTLEALLGMKLNARLVVLSACETGMLADLKRADEFVSLSVGLLQAGCAAVIASLWSVRDDSTMILINRFYYLWQAQGYAPAQALRLAQRWLRDGSVQDRIDFFAAYLPKDMDKLRPVLEQDFSHPYHWAGFNLVGV
jgi:CHAT domain-containing protein